MAARNVYITQHDAERLQEWLQLTARNNEKDRANLLALKRELDRARLIDSHKVPPDVVTMRSRVRLVDLRTEQASVVTLSFPDDAMQMDGRVSVLAPLGAALLGCRAGQTVRFQVPGGTRTVRVEQILYQPEAAGHYHV
jgi:regulator of nucleoside diphosphate kinase